MYKQSPLPGFPDGAQRIGTWLSILEKDGVVSYFLGGDNYFSHRKGNFFAYMMQHYDIDGLIEYGAENVPGTLLVVNAQWRGRDKAVRKGRQTERKLQADLARRTAREGGEIHKKAELVEAIQAV